MEELAIAGIQIFFFLTQPLSYNYDQFYTLQGLLKTWQLDILGNTQLADMSYEMGPPFGALLCDTSLGSYGPGHVTQQASRHAVFHFRTYRSAQPRCGAVAY